ncbi:tetratricopeptide repeat protein [Algivirga pacifica]
MKVQVLSILLGLCMAIGILCCINTGALGKVQQDSLQQFKEPMYKPLIERYILDELKQLRVEQEVFKKNIHEQVVNLELKSADRAIRYTTDTTTNIFYIITIAASILVILGWRSLSDIKDKIESITAQKIDAVTQQYEERLSQLESNLKQRSKDLLQTQEKLAVTNQVQSLWRRAAIEEKVEEKVHIYDQILTVNPKSVEAMTYKADSLLDMEEIKWAISLLDQAIEIDPTYYLAYWQRACAFALLGNIPSSIQDLKRAIEYSDLTAAEIEEEPALKSLRKTEKYKTLIRNLKI